MKLILDNCKEIELTKDIEDRIITLIEDNTTSNTQFSKINFDELYYYIDSYGTVSSYTNRNDETDMVIHKNLNAFNSEEFAQKLRNRQLLERKLIKFSLEHNGDKIDWEDNDSYKYFIDYNYRTNISP